MNYTDLLVGNGIVTTSDPNPDADWDSGYMAATEGTNMTQYLSLYGYVLNGTSRK
jgi:hypothetical protein